jgi:hypothetical protein
MSAPEAGDSRRLLRLLSPATLAAGAAIGFLIALVRPRSWK